MFCPQDLADILGRTDAHSEKIDFVFGGIPDSKISRSLDHLEASGSKLEAADSAASQTRLVCC